MWYTIIKVFIEGVINLQYLGLRVYKDYDFGGESRDIVESTTWVGKDWNDVVSSVDAIQGTWRLYREAFYQGQSMLVCSGRKYSYLDFNDDFTSSQLVSDDECSKYSIRNHIFRFKRRV